MINLQTSAPKVPKDLTSTTPKTGWLPGIDLLLHNLISAQIPLVEMLIVSGDSSSSLNSAYVKVFFMVNGSCYRALMFRLALKFFTYVQLERGAFC